MAAKKTIDNCKVTITQEILDENPELAAQGVAVGDEIEVEDDAVTTPTEPTAPTTKEDSAVPPVENESTETVPLETLVTNADEINPVNQEDFVPTAPTEEPVSDEVFPTPETVVPEEKLQNPPQFAYKMLKNVKFNGVLYKEGQEMVSDFEGADEFLRNGYMN